jgi:hypothetical protein
VHDAHFLAVILCPDLGSEGHIDQFGYGKSIHVGPEGDDRPWQSALQESDDPGVSHPGLNLHAQGPEMLGYDPGCPKFPVPQFRMLVEIPTPGHHLLGDGLSTGVDLCPKNIQVRALGDS